MTILENYLRAAACFASIVATLPADRWDGPSACTEWTARDVLGHVVWGQELVRHVAIGSEFTEQYGAPGAPAPGRQIGADPVEAWRAAHVASTAALSPESLRREFDTRVFGRLPLERFLEPITTDLLAHTWDIGAPAGLSVRLDPVAVTAGLAWSRTVSVRAPGGVGPEVPVPADADEQSRFIGHLGRDPRINGMLSASRG